jgi:hypothetical protein
MTSVAFPIIDLGPWFDGGPSGRRAVADQVRTACESIGFFAIVGHRVPDGMIEAMRSVSRDFFDLPPPPGRWRGTPAARAEPRLSRRGDGDPGAAGRQRDPTRLQGGVRHRTARRTRGRSLASQRTRRLPELRPQPLALGPSRLRAFLASLLVGDGGLETRDLDGKWHEAPQVEEGFVVNVGDILMRWSNDRFRSTLHRVANPRAGGGARRLSIAYFVAPAYDALIECLPGCATADRPPKYPAVTVAAYRNAHFARTAAPIVTAA